MDEVVSKTLTIGTSRWRGEETPAVLPSPVAGLESSGVGSGSGSGFTCHSKSSISEQPLHNCLNPTGKSAPRIGKSDCVKPMVHHFISSILSIGH
jgi:hypothetical protein